MDENNESKAEEGSSRRSSMRTETQPEMKIRTKLVTPPDTSNTTPPEVIHRSLTGNPLDDRRCGHGTLDTRWPTVSRRPDEQTNVWAASPTPTCSAGEEDVA